MDVSAGRSRIFSLLSPPLQPPIPSRSLTIDDIIHQSFILKNRYYERVLPHGTNDHLLRETEVCCRAHDRGKDDRSEGDAKIQPREGKTVSTTTMTRR